MNRRSAARPDGGALLAEADRIRAMSPGPLRDSVDLIREERNCRGDNPRSSQRGEAPARQGASIVPRKKKRGPVR